jgi:surface protein
VESMSKVVVTKEKLVAIGDALRDKTEATEAYSLDEMPEVIQGIETGEGGADFTISDASYLFHNGARLDYKDVFMGALSTELIGMRNMFYGCNALNEIDLSKYDTSDVSDMAYMFYGCSNLKSLNISTFNTSKVQNMESMFTNCINLEALDLSNFDTSQNKNLSQFVSNCRFKSINLSNFDTSATT